MKKAIVIGVLMLAVASLSACGGKAKDVAVSRATFCAGAKSFSVAAADTGDWAGVQKAAKKLLALGTPKDMKATEKSGIERAMKLIADSKDVDTLKTASDKLPKTEKAEIDAMDAYVSTTCKKELE